MAVDQIRYDLLTQQALRGVVRAVLTDAAKKGLPGDHHFYISFDTHAEGLKLSPRMRAQYPEEMTIVLQHQFWDLVVSDDRFEVGLSFGGVPERLVIPFEAVTAFVDPSVEFGLRFEPVTEGTDHQNLPQAHSPIAAVSQNTGAAETPAPERNREAAPATAVPTPPAEDAPTKPSGSAEVVRLDRFRKK